MLETCPQCNQLSLIKEPLGRELNMSTGVSKDLIEYKCLNCKNTLTKQLTLRKGGHCGPPTENVTGIHRMASTTKDLNIEDLFQMDGYGFYCTTILDAELNPMKCCFLGSVFVEIDTKDIARFRLSIENLKELILLIKKVDKKYKKDYKSHLIN